MEASRGVELSVSVDRGRPPRSPDGRVQDQFDVVVHRRLLHPVRMLLSSAAAGRLCDAGAARLPAGSLTCLPALNLSHLCDIMLMS